jgi:glucan 1,3-beta-glucosidase
VTFDTCGLGVDLTKGDAGSFVLLDSKSTNSGPAIKFTDLSNNSGNRNNQIVIENLQHDTQNPIVIKSDDSVALEAVDTVDTWVWGNADPGNYQTGTQYTTVRSDSLLKDENYFTKDTPTYGQYASDQIVNVKAVADHPVKGDGQTDDSTSLNAILLQNSADCKIT